MSQGSQPSPQAGGDRGMAEVYADTHRGQVREANEDHVYPQVGASRGPVNVDPAKLAAKGVLAIVADGVGGGQVGSRISERAVHYVSDGYYDGRAADAAANLRLAVQSANLWLHDLICRDPALSQSQAATTLTAVAIQGNTVTVAHVGDSRAYLIAGGAIQPITTDHTLSQDKVAAGRIRLEDVPADPDRSTLTRSLGSGPEVQVDVHQGQVAPGTVVLLCSDGLYDVVEDDEIRAIAGRQAPRNAVRKLIALANRRGGPDNISVAVMRVPGNAAAPGRLGRMLIGALIGLLALGLILAVGYAVARALHLLGGSPASTAMPALSATALPGIATPTGPGSAAATMTATAATRVIGPTSTPITPTPTYTLTSTPTKIPRAKTPRRTATQAMTATRRPIPSGTQAPPVTPAPPPTGVPPTDAPTPTPPPP